MVRSRLWGWVVSRDIGLWVVLLWLVGWCWVLGSWVLFVLLFPLYWQVYLKKWVVPEWW